MKPYEETCAYFRIREGTRSEFVAVGSHGNILRWGETGGDDQLWLPIPAEKGKVKFMTKQNKNDEYMSVGQTGNVLRWGDTGGPEQLFELVQPTGDGGWNIQESTRGEYVAVGSDGNIVRWGWTGGSEQTFKLEPYQPAAKPDLQAGECGPGAIGDVPRLVSFETNPPEQSRTYLIGETLLPATVVDDPYFKRIFSQVETTPYYIVRREQYWDRTGDRGFLTEHSGKYEEEVKKEIRYRITTTEGHSSQSILGFEFGVKGGYSRGSKKTRTLSAELSAKFSSELKTVDYGEKKVDVESTFTYKETFPLGPRFKLAAWSLVDRYSLLRYSLLEKKRTLVVQWDIALDNTTIVDGFPREAVSAYCRKLTR